MFTPSILTILGVIMYMRLPWIVGHGGLYLALGIIIAAHVISVTTGLSVSSIATDKRVEAGGAYYIVSRSMGLAIGGTLGMALFVGLSFSISLYIIGFSESFLDFWGFQTDLQTIRICGTVSIILLTVITFISTSLAIRTQYLILALIAASLASVFMGSTPVPSESVHLTPYPGGEAATVLFGIFFPAVTGFTAGVNMSGDLQDPRRSIPVGTVLAIGAGLIVYLSLAVFMAVRVPAEQLVNNGRVLLEIAWSPNLVVGGIWGATLSSALGSILGAPRILQALSLDHITPRIFGSGHGPTNEPRYALVLAFVIGEAGILVGELDAIARVVSVFFIATYGFLNLSASFEMIASPDFRPDFKIPRWVPVVGAVTCAVLMIWLDLLAMLGAVVVMSLLFVFIKRRELQLETGDTLLGVWSSVVRAGLHRLTSETLHERNWRPNILLFTQRELDSRRPLLDFGLSLIRHRGVATEFLLSHDAEELAGASVLLDEEEATGESVAVVEEEDPFPSQQGFFHRDVPVEGDRYDTMGAVCRFHGFSGLEPNTVMLDWHDHARHPAAFARFLGLLERLDYNVMSIAFDAVRGFGDHRHIDLWWSGKAGSLALNIALVRFITSAEEWRRADLRFFVLNDDPALTDALHRSTAGALAQARVEATVKVVNNAIEARRHEDWIAQYSANTDLVVIGLPSESITTSDVSRYETLVRRIGCVLVVRPSSQFAAGFTHATSTTLVREPTEEVGDFERVHLRRVRLPEPPELADQASRFAEAHMLLASDFCERCLRGGFTSRSVLIETLREDIEAQYLEFEAVLQGAGARRRARTLRRGPEALLRRAHDALQSFEEAEVGRTLATSEAGVEALLEGLEALEEEVPASLVVSRIAQDLAPEEHDPPHLRRFKRNRRVVARLLRRPPRYRIKPRPLARHYLHLQTLTIAQAALRDAASHTMLVAEDLGRFFNVLKESLVAVQRRYRGDELDAAFLAAERLRVVGQLQGLLSSHEEACERQMNDVVLSARNLEQAFADDLDRLDVSRVTRRERRVPRSARELATQLRAMPPIWAEHQMLFLRRAALAPLVATVQSRLTGAILEASDTLDDAIRTGVQARCQALKDGLEAYREAVLAGGSDVSMDLQPHLEGGFDEAQIVEDLHQALQTATAHVPETLTAMREASIQALATDPFIDVEVSEVGLRKQLQFLIDVELVGPIQEILSEVPRAEQRATSVAEDVVRLITFTRTDVGVGDRLDEALTPVIDNGIARVDVELTRLDELARSLAERVQGRLEHVLDLTDNFAILGTAEAFEARGTRGGPKLSGIGRLTERVTSELKKALVTLAYRRSAGVLLARRMQGPEYEAPVDAVHGLVDACTPRRDVLDALPFYYAQLFLGGSAVHSAFWVGREAELQQIERAIARYDRGFFGSVVVTGEPGSGKTALCEVAIERFLSTRPVYRISPPTGGSCSPADFHSVLQQELRLAGSVDAMMEALPERSVVVLYDAELWWERTPDGLAVIELVADLVQRFGDRCLFLIELGLPAYRLLRTLSPFAAEALAVVECGPVDAEVIKDIVLLRHNSTGLRFEVDGRHEDEVTEWALAQLFTAHFDHCDGNVGAALASWVAHVESFKDGTLSLATPRPLDHDAMRALSADWMALLLQLVLHKELTVGRLQRVTGLERVGMLRDLAALRRMGLVGQRRRDVVELEAGPQHAVVRALRERGMLP